MDGWEIQAQTTSRCRHCADSVRLWHSASQGCISMDRVVRFARHLFGFTVTAERRSGPHLVHSIRGTWELSRAKSIAYFDTNYFTFFWFVGSYDSLYLLYIEHLLSLSPPPRSLRTPLRALYRTLLHPIRHSPPFLNFCIRRHARHVLVEGVAHVFEGSEKRGSRA